MSESGIVLNHYRRAVDEHPYEVQRTFVDELRRRGLVEGESARANFTPFLIPVGGPLRRPGRGRVILAGDAGGFVNGFHGGGDLLRHGFGRARRQKRRRVGPRRRGEPGAPVPPCGRSRNWRRAAGFSPDPAVSVRGSPPDCARRGRRAACTRDHPPDPRFRGRRALVSNAAPAGVLPRRRSLAGGCCGSACGC